MQPACPVLMGSVYVCVGAEHLAPSVVGVVTLQNKDAAGSKPISWMPTSCQVDLIASFPMPWRSLFLCVAGQSPLHAVIVRSHLAFISLFLISFSTALVILIEGQFV